jgi:superfamily II DNA or RNA helicase
VLQDLEIKGVYDSEENDPVGDFLVPVLSTAVCYDRAVGYFSAAVFYYLSEGLSALIENKGKMRLLIGSGVSEEEEKAILEGYKLKSLEQRLEDEIKSWKEIPEDHFFWKRLSCLTWMIENGYLDVKVAVRRHGLYHEKIGIVKDGCDDFIVFQGSANETFNALNPLYNFESFNVFKSWNENMREDHCLPHVRKFEKLWNNKYSSTLTVDFPEAVRERLVETVKRNHSSGTLLTSNFEIEYWNRLKERLDKPEGRDVNGQEELPRIPSLINGKVFKLKLHQELAIKNWQSNNFRGIFELCTGAGKTFTSIYSICRLFDSSKSNKLFVVICVPYINLADQWQDNLKVFNINPVRCYGNFSEWHSRLQGVVNLYSRDKLQFACVVVVNKTMKSSSFYNIIKTVPGSSFLWVGDEVHHHDSENSIKYLPENAKLRLGLSATIENCKRIKNYYGDVVAEYNLKNAIEDGVLSNYKYYPQLVYLNRSEVDDLIEIETKIMPLEAMKANGHSFDEGNLNILYSKRNNIIGNAEDKLSRLGKIVDKQKVKETPTLFYTSTTINEEDEDEMFQSDYRQIDKVVKILKNKGLKVSRYTSRENKSERVRILDSFKSGNVDCLVAIRCLDEGVDIPAVGTAYIIASSSNSKQFIQRRGRVLRLAEGKEYAFIYDFVVAFEPRNKLEEKILKRLLKSELKRVNDFADQSSNPGEALSLLKPIFS